MDMTYQLMDQLTTATASTTGQTGTKRDAGTQETSDGGFETMVRQKTADRTGTTDKAAAQDAAKAAPEEVREDDRIEMAAAMLLQPQVEIVYVTDTEATAAEEALPALETAVDLLSGQTAEAGAQTMEAPEAQEAPEIAETRSAQRFAPAAEARAQTEEKPAAEPARPQTFAAAAPAQPEAEAPKVELDGQSGSAELPMDTRRDDGEERIGNRIENVQVETPVFGSLDAAPVKVGAAETVERPVELEAPDGAEQLAEQIGNMLVYDAGEDRIGILLYPAELGEVKVELTRGQDGTVQILLSATTEKATAILEKNTATLQNLLTSQERPAVQVSVRENENTQQQFLNPDGQNRNQQQQQQSQQQRRPRQDALRIADFMNQLRLGLVDLSAAV